MVNYCKSLPVQTEVQSLCLRSCTASIWKINGDQKLPLHYHFCSYESNMVTELIVIVLDATY